MESVIPDIPLKPNDKIAMDIYGPLPETIEGNKYILSIQDRLTRYTVLLPLKNETTKDIIEQLIDHYIYVFGAPKTILTDQGQNFVSDLMLQFEEALQIQHIKTTSFHPQSNGNIERMHSTLGNLIKTSMAENNKEWDYNLKFINFVINTTKNQTTGFSPFELTFGREPNLPSTIQQNHSMTYQELIRKWKKRHEINLSRARERISLENEKTKKYLDAKIINHHPLYKVDQLVKVKNNTKTNKLDPSWKGPYKIINVLDNNNLKILTKNKVVQVHIDNVMPYFSDEGQSFLTNSDNSGQSPSENRAADD